jgi:hypothetical protein
MGWWMRSKPGIRGQACRWIRRLPRWSGGGRCKPYSPEPEIGSCNPFLGATACPIGPGTPGSSPAAGRAHLGPIVWQRSATPSRICSVLSPDPSRPTVRCSTKNHVGDRFQASLEQPLIVDDNVVAAKGAGVYGRLEESMETGTFTGRSVLKVALTGIVVDGQPKTSLPQHRLSPYSQR